MPKTAAQLQRDIDEALAKRHAQARRRHHSTMGGVNSVNDFWDLVEEELTKSVAEAPEKYALRPDEPAEVYARRIRTSFQQTAEEKGLRWMNLGSITWKHVAKRLGITKFSQGRLKEAYAALGGKP